MRRLLDATAALAVVGLCGCDLAPAYHPRVTVLPASYQGACIWQRAHPDDMIARGPWWRAYVNPTLDALEARLPRNPNLLAARESFEQARDLAAEAEAGLYPQLGSSFAPTENKQSVHRLFRSSTSTAPLIEPSIQLDATADWEIDLWDRIGNQAKAQKALAQANAADLASLDLSLQAELANDYIALRGLDLELALYHQTVQFYQTGVDITNARLADKIGNLLDVERARNQLGSAEALETDTLSQRDLAQHAIATLIDVPASAFVLPPQSGTPLAVPEIPSGMPSSLLQRRPDIAAAERAMAAANAEIGVARAAFYPNISLSGLAGMQDSGFDLVSLPNSMWSIGAAIAEPIFEGGLRTAELRFARSSYDQTRDGYRATVLAAVQDVEDELALTHLLATESQQDQQALAAASKVQSLALELYRSGADSYLDVVVAQVSDLQAGVGQVGTFIRAQQASVDLVRALGGGWDRSELPPTKDILPFDPLVPG